MKVWHSVYNSDGWVLGICTECGRLHYVEPHGTTAHCPRCKKWTEHANIPQAKRNFAGTSTYLDARKDNRSILEA